MQPKVNSLKSLVNCFTTVAILATFAPVGVQAQKLYSCDTYLQPNEPKIEQAFEQLKPLLKYFELPKVKIELLKTPGLVQFRANTMTIEVSSQMSNDLFFIPSVQHEYGHAIFHVNMAKFDPHWKQWMEIIERGGAGEYFLRPQLTLRISRHYQELFSYLLQMTANEDPELIKKLVMHQGYYATYGDRYSYAEPLISTTGWCTEDWLSEDHRIHMCPTPIGKLLWVKYLSLQKNRKHRARIFEILFNTIAKEILARAKKESLHRLDAENLNNRLITKLKKNLSQYQ